MKEEFCVVIDANVWCSSYESCRENLTSLGLSSSFLPSLRLSPSFPRHLQLWISLLLRIPGEHMGRSRNGSNTEYEFLGFLKGVKSRQQREL